MPKELTIDPFDRFGSINRINSQFLWYNIAIKPAAPRYFMTQPTFMPCQNMAFKTRDMEMRAVISEIIVATTGTIINAA